ncbi:MAG TPA: helix-turn-helix domain-containing protein [Xanthobacteraceae bacterium]|nr:helix-turn-helix domain-containing protein [Xanthobacteraceae bacterium]
MEKIFSTAEVHPRDRFAYWHDVACEVIAGHDSATECRQTFRAELRAGTLADLGLILFENAPMTVSRTMRHVSQSNSDDLFVCHQVAGTLALEQDSRQVLLQPGDLTLLDPQLPYVGNFFAGSKLLVVRIPRRRLEARLGKIRPLTARSIKPAAAETRLTSAFLPMLAGYAGALTKAADAIIANQVLDLIALSFTTSMGRGKRRASDAISVGLGKVRAAIESQLTNPSLDPAAVAAHAAVSVRYANLVLATQGTSVMRLVRERRLERCRAALTDPSQVHRKVSDIAYSWGFSDLTHFARSFRAAFGTSPRDYRRSVKHGVARHSLG